MDEHEPDSTETAIRFGCGSLLGAVLSFFTVLYFVDASSGAVAVVFLSATVLCAWLAMRYGDRFWYTMVDWLRWI